MSDTPIELTKQHFSTKIFKAFIYYIETNFPHVDIRKLIEDAGLTYEYIKDESNWVSVTFSRRFTKLAAERTGCPDISMRAGKQPLTPQSIGRVLYFLTRNTIPIRKIYDLIASYTNLFSKVTSIKIIKNDGKEFVVQMSIIEENLDSEDYQAVKDDLEGIFENTIGYYAAIPTCQDLPMAEPEIFRIERTNRLPIYEVTFRYQSRNPLHHIAWFLFPCASALVMTAISHWIFELSAAESVWTTYLAFSIATIYAFYRRSAALQKQIILGNEALNLQGGTFLKLQKHKEAADKFIPWEFVNTVNPRGITALTLSDNVEVRQTVLFCDIRGFSRRAEQLGPKKTLEFLNHFFSLMGPVIEANKGKEVNYAGDEIFAIFSKSSDAVTAAFHMVEQLRRYNLSLAEQGKDIIEIGIGINTGEMTLGVLGYHDQMRISVISDHVNVAKRLQTISKDFGSNIVIGEGVLQELAPEMRNSWRYLGRVKLKGKLQKVSIFELIETHLEPSRGLIVLTKNLFEEAVSLYEANKTSEAKQMFEKILNQHPLDRAAQYYLKLIHSNQSPDTHEQSTSWLKQ